MKVQNDIVWTINYPVDPNNNLSDGVIIIYDINGDILDSYYLCRDEFNGFLNCASALFLENNSFIATWNSQGYSSGVGVNLNSIMDQTLIKINNQKSTDWITTLDFSNLSDNFAEIMVYDKYVYISIGTGILGTHYCLGELLMNTGELIRSKWYNVASSGFYFTSYFWLILISDKHMVTVQNY